MVYGKGFQLTGTKQAHECFLVSVSPWPFSHLTDSGCKAPEGQGAEGRPKEEAGRPPQPKKSVGF